TNEFSQHMSCMMDPVWQQNLEIFRQMTDDEKDAYLSQLNDSLVHLAPKAKDLVIAYMEFLEDNAQKPDKQYDSIRDIVADGGITDPRLIPDSPCYKCDYDGSCTFGCPKHGHLP